MEQQPEAPVEESIPAQSSLGSRLFNVFSSPGEVFAGMKGAPKSAGNWVVPLLLGIVVAIASMFIIFSRPSIQQQMVDIQRQQFDKQIQSGKMTQEQADQAEQYANPSSTMFKVFGAVGAAIMTLVLFLLIALLYWLIGKLAFKAPIGYGASLEAVGLSYMVMILGSVISVLTIFAFDSLYATPSLAIAVSPFDPNNGVHKFLSQINVFTLWFVALMGIGLSKMTDAAIMKAMIWVFGIFIIIALVFSFAF